MLIRSVCPVEVTAVLLLILSYFLFEFQIKSVIKESLHFLTCAGTRHLCVAFISFSMIEGLLNANANSWTLCGAVANCGRC